MTTKHTWPCPHCGQPIEGRGPPSPATRSKISRAMRGRTLSPEHIEALRDAARRRVRRQKRSKS